MATYYVDDGGSATDPYDTWAKAATSLSALDDAKALASGDIVYIGHDHVCAYTHVGNRIIVGPTSGAPCYIISATQGSSPPTYAASTTNQIDTTEGAYSLTFDGAFALYGVCMKSGADITIGSDFDEQFYTFGVTFKPAAAKAVSISADVNVVMDNTTIDCSSDSGATSAAVVGCSGRTYVQMRGGSFVSVTNRTGSVFDVSLGGKFNVSGMDLSGFTNATPCEIVRVGGTNTNDIRIENCKTASTWAPVTTTAAERVSYYTTFVNVGTTDNPAYIYHLTSFGYMVNDTVTRTGGATVEGTATSWKVTTVAGTTEAAPFYTPWIYGVCSSTGSKTFTVYIGNNTGDLTNAECWLEVESMGDAGGSPMSELTTNHRTITTTAAAQTDDTTSTWSSAQTYMQSLAVTQTVDQAGLFRARVAVAKASVATLYVDPIVFVDGIAASSQYLLPGGVIGVPSGGGAGLVGSGRGLVA